VDQDKSLTCSDCGAEFVFTAKDQAYYSERGFVAPKRCRNCRDARKAQSGGGSRGPSRGPRGGGYGPPRGAYEGGRGGFEPRGGYEGGGGGGGGEPMMDDGGGRGGYGRQQRFFPDQGAGAGPRRPLYDAVCSSCGKPTTVPFRPAAGRPVYCRDCYKSGKGAPMGDR